MVNNYEAAPSCSLQYLKDLLLMFWCQIQHGTLRGLVESMPWHVGAALADQQRIMQRQSE